MIDSASCKAHQASFGAHPQSSVDWNFSWSPEHEDHAVCDALGTPRSFKLTPGRLSSASRPPASKRSPPSKRSLKARGSWMRRAGARGIWRRNCFKG